MKTKWMAALCASMACNGTLMAGALDECTVKGDSTVVHRCLVAADTEAQTALRHAEGNAGTRAREIDTASGRPGANAALAKSLRAFADYRRAQCDYVKALYASAIGAEAGALGCRIDLTRRRLRDLQN